MSREIKFRGKAIKTGKWVYGDVHFNADCSKCHIHKRGERVFESYDVVPETVGQCTGKKDKNGKEIWEDDIVRLSDNVIHEGVLVKCVWQATRVGFYYIFLTGENKGKLTDMVDDWRKYEVINNIHDKSKE